MAAYVVVLRDGPVRDAAAMDEYRRLSRLNPDKHETTPLVIYGATHALEGEAPDGVVMLRFATVEAARAWYDSPGYQAAVPHRLKAGHYRSFIVEGL